jgi:hypothetical protein
MLQLADTVIFLTRVETKRYKSFLVNGLENMVESKLLCNGAEQIRPWRICLG